MHSSLFTCSAWKIGVCEFRGSATGFLIAVEPKTRKALPAPRIAAVNHRLYMPVTSNCAPPRHVNCWQHSSEQPARIIHIFTGSQINSPLKPRDENLKTLTTRDQHFHFQLPKTALQVQEFGPKRASVTHSQMKPGYIHFCSFLSPKPNLLFASPNQPRQKAALVNNWAAAWIPYQVLQT